MSGCLKIVFMGNHTVGVIALRELTRIAHVVAVFAHPPHPDDGVVYESVAQFAIQHDIHLCQPSGIRDAEWVTTIRDFDADLIFVTDYNRLLPPEIIECPRLGCINLHPSLLPRYRGRAPVNWAILNGESETGLTAHFIDAGVDTGDIIFQERVRILRADTIADIHQKLFPLYASMTRRLIDALMSGRVPRVPQNHGDATTFPRRRPADGLINWREPAVNICNLVRAVTRPYPGAFTHYRERPVFIWAARVIERVETPQGSVPGTILRVSADGVVFSTGDGTLLATDIELGSSAPATERAIPPDLLKEGHVCGLQEGARIADSVR